MRDVDVLLFPQDTLEKVKEKIAVEVESLPQYIVILSADGNPNYNFETLTRKGDRKIKFQIVDVYDLLNSDRNLEAIRGSIPDSAWKQFGNVQEISKIYALRQVEKIKGLGDEEKAILLNNFMAQFASKVLQQTLSENVEITSEDLRQYSRSNFAKKIGQLRQAMLEYSRSVLEWLQVKEAPHTDFEELATEVQKTLELPTESIYEVFNALCTGPKAPLIRLNDFYKIFQFRKFDTKSFDESEAKDTIQILVENSLVMLRHIKGQNFVLKFEVKSKDTVIMEAVREVFREMPFTILNQEAPKTKGQFSFTNQKLDTQIFGFLAMNDPRFSEYLYINERITPISQLKASSLTAIFYKKEYTIKATMIYIAEGNFVRVKVTFTRREHFLDMAETLSRLITLYNQEASEVEGIFKRLNPETEVGTVVKVQPKKKAEPSYPSKVLVGGWARICQTDHQPDFSTLDRKGELVAKKKRFIEFPQAGPTDERFLWICPGSKDKDGKYIYPGLQKKFKNEYGYLPCCFKSDQTTGPKRPLVQYLNQLRAGSTADEESEQKKQTRNITLGKVLNYGVLGENGKIDSLNKFGLALLQDTIRIGMDDTPLSFLECVLVALGRLDALSREERITMLREEIRRTVAGKDEEFFNVALQELYDVEGRNIKKFFVENILVGNKYLDPRLYIRLIEETYNVNIFVFDDQSMVIPRHIRSYVAGFKPRRCIFIYENTADNSPRCELISVERKPIITKIFEPSSDISRLATDIFMTLIKSFQLSQKMTGYEIDLRPFGPGTLQIVDSAGKLSGIRFRNGLCGMLQEPSAPLAWPIDRNQFQILEESEVRSKLRELNFSPQPIIFRENESSPLKTKIFGIVLCFPVKKTGEKKSMLAVYRFNKILSHVLKYYALYLYSIFVEKNQVAIDTKSIKEFVEQTLVVRPEVFGELFMGGNTEKLPYFKEFVTDSRNPFFDVVRKTVKLFTPEDIREKIAFFLAKVDPKVILEAKKLRYLPVQFRSISEFSQSPSQTILKGLNQGELYNKTLNRTYKAYSGVRMSEANAYFINNDLIDPDRAFLAVNCEDRDEAMSVLIHWQGEKILSREEADLSTSIKVPNVYEYQSATNIQPRGTVHTDNQTCILGYNKDLFTVLLA